MSIKQEAHQFIDQLPEDATWDGLVKELYRQKKITLGLSEEELQKETLEEKDLNAVLGRISSSKDLPDDMRNTKDYKPGNATTIGMVGGIVAVIFSFVFPPIAWMGAAIAAIGGAIGLKNHEARSWVPILLALISLLPMLVILTEHNT